MRHCAVILIRKKQIGYVYRIVCSNFIPFNAFRSNNGFVAEIYECMFNLLVCFFFIEPGITHNIACQAKFLNPGYIQLFGRALLCAAVLNHFLKDVHLHIHAYIYAYI